MATGTAICWPWRRQRELCSCAVLLTAVEMKPVYTLTRYIANHLLSSVLYGLRGWVTIVDRKKHVRSIFHNIVELSYTQSDFLGNIMKVISESQDIIDSHTQDGDGRLSDSAFPSNRTVGMSIKGVLTSRYKHQLCFIWG